MEIPTNFFMVSIKFNLDASKAQEGPKLMSGDIGYDEFAGTLSPLGFANLGIIKEASEETFRYVRIHNLFTSREGDHRGARDAGGDPVKVKEDGSYYYDWTIVDMVLQSILDVGCVPFIELGFTPTPWTSKDEVLKRNYEDLDLELQDKLKSSRDHPPGFYPPIANNLWEDLLDKFFVHLKEKFGELVIEWPLGLWNEPDIHYFQGTLKEYCVLWKLTYRVSKKHGMKILGGPAIAGKMEWLKNFLNYCVKENCYPDYIDWHVKGTDPTKLIANSMFLWMGVQKGKDQIPPELKNTPIWLSEFDPIVGCERGYVDDPGWGFRNMSYYASWLGKSCYLLAICQQSRYIEDAEYDEDIGELVIDTVFNDGHHVTAEGEPFYSARVMSTPIWVEKTATMGETIDPLSELKKDPDFEMKYPSLVDMLADIDRRMVKPANSENYVLKALPKPIFRAFEICTNLTGKFIPFSNKERHIYGVIAIDNGVLNICMGIHNDYKPLGDNTEVDCIVKIQCLECISSNYELIESKRIDIESCNPLELWKKMDEPLGVSEEDWRALQKSTIPEPALDKDINFNEKQNNLKIIIHLLGNSINFLKFKKKKRKKCPFTFSSNKR